MLPRVRRRLLRALKSAGFFGMVAGSSWRQQRLLVLCYHGVSIADEHRWNGQLYMSAALLGERFEMLARGGYQVLPLQEGLERLRTRTLPPRAVALTFDDGAHDFYERARPLLEQYGFPATVYQTTYYLHFQRPVFDTGCAYLLWRSGRREADPSDLHPGSPALPLDTDAARRSAAAYVREYTYRERLSGMQKDDLLRRLADRLGLDYDDVFRRRLLFLMSPDEVGQISREGFDVQLHTHRHRTPEARGDFLREIDDNRDALENIVGPGPREHFCYPSGMYRPAFIGWLKQAQIRSATTCDFGLASIDDEPLLLPRLVDTSNISPIELEAWLTGIAEWLPHRRYTQVSGATLASRARRASGLSIAPVR